MEAKGAGFMGPLFGTLQIIYLNKSAGGAATDSLTANESPKMQDGCLSCPIITVTKIVSVTSSTNLEQLILSHTCQNKLFSTLMWVFMRNIDANRASKKCQNYVYVKW